VQEGEVTFTIKGQPRACSSPATRSTCRAHRPPQPEPHRQAARAINLNIMDKDKPQTEQVTN